MILTFDTFKGKFNYRAAGIAINGNKVLLNKLETEKHWYLPGGRVELGEPSSAALKREMLEEINANIQIKKLRFVIENFFEYRRKIFHEIGLYYDIEIDLPNDDIEFYGIEEDKKLIYRWFSFYELKDIDLYPAILKDKLFNAHDTEFHFVIEE